MMSLCKWHSGLGWSNRGLFGRRKTGVIEAQTADAPENKARRRVPTRAVMGSETPPRCARRAGDSR